jgi:hypothetical protein
MIMYSICFSFVSNYCVHVSTRLINFYIVVHTEMSQDNADICSVL